MHSSISKLSHAAISAHNNKKGASKITDPKSGTRVCNELWKTVVTLKRSKKNQNKS